MANPVALLVLSIVYIEFYGPSFRLHLPPPSTRQLEAFSFDLSFEDQVSLLVQDIWRFVPLVALTHASHFLLRASAEGQLNDASINQIRAPTTTTTATTTATTGEKKAEAEEEELSIIRRRDRKFNWLRHALDHVTVYEEAMREIERKDGEGEQNNDEVALSAEQEEAMAAEAGAVID